MNISANIKCLNKKVNDYTNKEGIQKEVRKILCSQDNDEVLTEIYVSQSVYDTIEKGKDYELIGEYRSTRNGNYIIWQSAMLVSAGTRPTL